MTDGAWKESLLNLKHKRLCLAALPWQSRKSTIRPRPRPPPPTTNPIVLSLSSQLQNRPRSLLFHNHSLLSLSSQEAMKMRNKGKVHPSPCSSSSSSSSSSSVCSPNNDAALSVLKLLPAAILAIASVLSPQDREVLAYMITRSMKATNPPVFLEEKSRKNSRKSSNNSTAHKSPSFDCECFDCYTSYWFRWDSSPNRELIHQVIEAFEEYLSMGEQSKKGKNKKKDKMTRRGIEKRLDLSRLEADNESPDIQETSSAVDASLENEAFPSELAAEVGENSQIPETSTVEEKEVVAEVEPPVVVSGTGASNHKGLARKVLPDVLGLFNSRLWSLWGPNV